MFPFAERHVSSALTGMLNAAVPLFAAIVESGLSRRLPSRGVAGGLAVGMTGAVLMAWPALHQGRSSVVGVLLILAALISYGFAINLARPLQQRNGALPVIWRAQAAALVLTAPLGISDLVHGQWITGPVLSLLALGMLGTGVALRRRHHRRRTRGIDPRLVHCIPHSTRRPPAGRFGAARARRRALHPGSRRLCGPAPG